MPGYTASNCLLQRTEGTDHHKLTVEAKYAKTHVCIDLLFKNGLWEPLDYETEVQVLKQQGLSGSQIAKTLHRRKSTVLEWLKKPEPVVESEQADLRPGSPY